MNRRRRSGLVIALVVLSFTLPATAAYALWRSTATASMSVTTANPPPTTLPPVTNLSCSPQSNTSVLLGWTAPSGAQPIRYEIYFADGLIDETTSTDFLVTTENLIANGQHTVRVRSIYTAGQSMADPGVGVQRNSGQGGRVTCS